MNKGMPWFVGLITAIMGAGAMALGIFIYVDHTEFENKAIYVDAEVLSVEVSVSESRDSDGRRTTSTSYYPTVEFTDHEGKRRVGKSVTASADFDFPVGTFIEIGYDPDNRADIRVRSKSYPLVALAFFLILGGVFFIVGLYFLIESIRNRTKPDIWETHAAHLKKGALPNAKPKRTREPTIRRRR